MNIATIGTGYVGLVTGALFASKGNNVICVDKNPKIVEQLRLGKVHFFEPGLEPIVTECVSRKTLSFTDDIEQAVSKSKIIFLCVGTPSNEDGDFNLDYVKSAATDVAKAMAKSNDFKVIVTKSTVSQTAYKIISDLINQYVDEDRWAYVSNPETLAEGTAVKDFNSPDRVIVGTTSDKAFALMDELYHPFTQKNDRMERCTPAEAELAKLFSNTALATKIATVNEFARIAETDSSVDMDRVRKLVCSDPRIGFAFMYPSAGYGGSCFPKDVQGLVCQAERDGAHVPLLSQVHASNEYHKEFVGAKVAKSLSKGSTVGIWGVTFKPKTDDMRDSASIPIITKLVNEGVKVQVYEPMPQKAKEIFGDKVTFVNDAYQAAQNADALVLLTEWSQFDAPDFEKLKSSMKGNILFDLRNRWLPKVANSYGFSYYGIGRNYPLH